MKKGISIIICSYNGAERLGKTIEYIARQAMDIPWELILVDNASTDDSLAVGKQEWQKHNLTNIPFKAITEPKAGKLYALQHAIREAQFEYLITCDDDNWLAPDYAKRVFDTFELMPEVGAIGGRGIPVTEGQPLPPWFKDYEVVYAVGPQAKKHGIMPVRSILWGAGMSTRRSVYLQMYSKHPSFLIGHETDIIFAEDTEYCLRLSLKGYRLFYDSNLVYHHFIARYKLEVARRDAYIAKFHEANFVLRKYYAAMRAHLKTKGRPDIWFMLLLITPINYIFSFSKRRAEKAKNTLFHLLPFGFKSDPISINIKDFIRNT